MGGLNSKWSWAGKSFTHFAALVGISSLAQPAGQAEHGNSAPEPCVGQGPGPASGTAQPLVPGMPGSGWGLCGAELTLRRQKYGQAGQALTHPEQFLVPEAVAKVV